ncbi:ABC transporter permease [Candidatus Latescibacterota bacterium]
MLGTLILKEIHETIINLRFLIAALLCLILIPLGMYVSLKDYERSFEGYQTSMRLYQERTEGRIQPTNFEAEGYRPPSFLSIFASGLENYLPDKVITSSDGQFRVVNESGIDNPRSLISGKIDFYFIVSFVLSILALIFTFNSISGERENGTLKLIISNSTPRWKIIIAKLIGNYTVFLAPLVVSLILMLLIVDLSSVVSVFSAELFPKILVIFAVTFVFLLSMFNLGILFSALTRRAITSMVILLFVWVIFALVIPKISPMIAEIIYPIKSQQVIDLEKQKVRSSINAEFETKRQELYEKLLRDAGLRENPTGPARDDQTKQAMALYDEQKNPLDNEYNARVAEEIRKIEEDYTNKQNIQSSITGYLSRISPVYCFANIVSEISGTGILEMNNFKKHARLFQESVEVEIYDKVIVKEYSTSSGSSVYASTVDGFEPGDAPVPHINDYKFVTLTEAFASVWIDILLLVFFNILFFTTSFVSFIRYDVR